MSTDALIAQLRDWVERSRQQQGLEKTVRDVKALRTIVTLLGQEEAE